MAQGGYKNVRLNDDGLPVDENGRLDESLLFECRVSYSIEHLLSHYNTSVLTFIVLWKFMISTSSYKILHEPITRKNEIWHIYSLYYNIMF